MKISRLAIRQVKKTYLYDLLCNSKLEEIFTPRIYAFGDSHVSVFSGKGSKNEPYMVPTWPQTAIRKNKMFVPVRLGSVLAYHAESYKKKIEYIINMNSMNFNKSKDCILLSFGEIDIRVHLLKQKIKQKKNNELIVSESLSGYFNLIQYLKEKDYKIIIYGPIASSKQTVIVENYCYENNIPFITIFYEMIDKQGETNEKFLMDDIHLSSEYLNLIITKLEKVIKN